MPRFLPALYFVTFLKVTQGRRRRETHSLLRAVVLRNFLPRARIDFAVPIYPSITPSEATAITVANNGILCISYKLISYIFINELRSATIRGPVHTT